MEDQDQYWMSQCLTLAKKAKDLGEVPVAAAIVKQGRLLALCHNEKEMRHLATGHAELLAIIEANQKLDSWRLLDTTLYTTLEPCIMCAGAILQARIPRVVIGAMDPKQGAFGSLYHLEEDKRLNHQVDLTIGIRSEESRELLQSFFRLRRKKL